MSKEIIVNSTKAHARIAIVEDKELRELYVENAENTRTIGDIHLARVRNLMPGIQAAFVDIGQKQDAFLHFSDVDDNLPDLLRLVGEKPTVNDFPVQPRTRRRSTQEREDADESEDESSSKKGDQKAKRDEPAHPAQYLRNGQRILVQITKEPIASKGSRVSSSISLAGRFLVLVPQADYVAVSRKISSNRERRRLRALARSLAPEGFGIIVRTVAEGRDAKTLDTDLNLLLNKWKKIEDKVESTKKVPCLLYEDVSMVSSVVRDLFTDDYDQILIDDPRLYRSIQNYVRAVAPHMVDVVRHYKGQKPIFESAGIADMVAEAFESRVELPSGGYIFIEHTEAMHVVDVNSGSAGKGQSQEENSLRVNLEAARVITRQLRLRDLGGIIVIDFIDMRDGNNRRKVYNELTRAFKKDRAVTKVLPMSDFGLVQITRQRLRPSITRDEQLGEEVARAKAERERREAEEASARAAEQAALEEAGRLNGRPQPSPEELVQSIERLLQRFRHDGRYRAVALRVHPFTAAYLNKGIPGRPARWFMKHRIRVRIDTDASFSPTVFEFQHPETGERLQLPAPHEKNAAKEATKGKSTRDRRSAQGKPSRSSRTKSGDQNVSESA